MSQIFLMSLDDVYPVGIYLQTSLPPTSTDPSADTFNPNTKWPGTTWEQLPEGTIIMASESDGSSYDNKLVASNIPELTSGGVSGRPTTVDIDVLNADVAISPRKSAWYPDEANDLLQVKENHSNNQTASYLDNTQRSFSMASGNYGWWKYQLNISHTHIVGTSSASQTDLSTILKHPICYIWLRTA